MAVVNKSIKINASVGKVFNFVTDPENWTRYVTSLVSVKNMSSKSAETGSTFNWEYKMMGFKFSGKGEVTDNVKNKRFGLSLKSRTIIDEKYEFVKNDDGTSTLKVRVEYEMPSQVLEYIMNTKIGEKLNSIESKHVLENIKAMCEA